MQCIYGKSSHLLSKIHKCANDKTEKHAHHFITLRPHHTETRLTCDRFEAVALVDRKTPALAILNPTLEYVTREEFEQHENECCADAALRIEVVYAFISPTTARPMLRTARTNSCSFLSFNENKFIKTPILLKCP